MAEDSEMTSPEFGDTPAMEDSDNNMAGGDDLDLDDAEDTVGKEINITPDGGVVKKILAPGTGWEKPERNDRVTVHYVGTLLDGSKFDSSRDRDEPFTFELGAGRVIKGWDLGVATMKKGEKALLTCRADYAYGDQGSPPKIPGGATLNFEVELLSWQSVKDIAGDGGIIKTIVQEGEGWQKPSDKDEVVVKFKVNMKGSDAVVAESPEDGAVISLAEPGDMLPGILTAVKTMKKKEKVHLELKPQYAYGETGREPHVPANAEVAVQLELTSIRKVEHVTDDGRVTKKTIEEDEAVYERPNEGSQVTVRYTARLPDGTVFDQHLEGNELTFTTDEEQVVDGLDQAMLKMKKGERALVTVAPEYGFGAAEHQAPMAVVPPNSTLVYDIELVSFVKAKNSWEMNDEEKVEAAAAKKEKGNKAYKEGKLKRAVRCYDKAVQGISYDTKFEAGLKARANDIKKSCHLNLGAVHLKQGDWKEVVKNCGKVLEIDAGNVKALYRRAQAYIATQDYFEADQDIRRGLEAEPKNADLLALQRRLRVLEREQNKKESQLYSKMFASKKSSSATAAATNGHAGGDANNGSHQAQEATA